MMSSELGELVEKILTGESRVQIVRVGGWKRQEKTSLGRVRRIMGVDSSDFGYLEKLEAFLFGNSRFGGVFTVDGGRWWVEVLHREK